MTEKKKEVGKEEIAKEQDSKKSIVLTTDGKNIDVRTNNLNALELEMMLIKALSAIRGKTEVQNADNKGSDNNQSG